MGVDKRLDRIEKLVLKALEGNARPVSKVTIFPNESIPSIFSVRLENPKQKMMLTGIGSFLLMFLGGFMLLLTRIGIDSNGYLVISPTFAIGLMFFGFAILLAIFGKR